VTRQNQKLKASANSFVKHWLPKSSRILYITTGISQLITLILKVANFLNYCIAAVSYCFRQYFTEKMAITGAFWAHKGLFKGLKGSAFERKIAAT
jgi:hypothetical protein